MKRLIAMAGLITLFLVPVSCKSGPDASPFYKLTPDEDQREVQWREEVRNRQGEILGYLENVRVQHAGMTEERSLYYVYDRFLEQPEGYISDRGYVFRFNYDSGRNEEIGPLGIEQGTARLLEAENIVFYRNGRQVTH